MSPAEHSHLAPILDGARFRIRDCFPWGLRRLTSHLTPWKDGARELRCGITVNALITAFGHGGGYRWSGRLTAGHATIEGRFAPSLDVRVSEPFVTETGAMEAADAAILGWFADRIADGSVVYPWPAVVAEPLLPLWTAAREV